MPGGTRRTRKPTEDADEPPLLPLVDQPEGEWALPVSRRAILIGVAAVSTTTATVWGLLEKKALDHKYDQDPVPILPAPATTTYRGELPGPAAAPAWTAKLTAPARRLAVAAGTVVVEDADGSLHGHDARGGTAKWTSAVSVYPDDSPLPVLGDLVFGLSSGARLQAVGAADGALRWQAEVAEPQPLPHQTSTTLGSTVVFTGTARDQASNRDTARVWAVDTATHKVVWTFEQAQQSDDVAMVASEPAGALLAAGVVRPQLVAYSLADRSRLWTKMPDAINSYPATGTAPQNCIAVSGTTFFWAAGSLQAIDAHTGTTLWSASPSSAADAFRAVLVVPGAAPGGGDLVVATTTGSNDPAVYGFAADSGLRVWKVTAGAKFGARTELRAVGKGGHSTIIAAESDTGSVIALDAETGDVRWSYRDEHAPGSLAWVTAVDDTRVYVAYGQTLLAFEA